MLFFKRLMMAALLSFSTFTALADCCQSMGGIRYCDSSAGRFVCNNGYYSACYCTRHAVMDIQKIEGCCLWQGGVLATPMNAPMDTNLIVCNNGSVSEICSSRIDKSLGATNEFLMGNPR